MRTRIVNYTRRRLPRRQLERAVQMVSRRFGRRREEVTLVFAGERRIKNLNRKYRGRDAATDVLSFMDGANGYWGEVVVCPERVERQARKLNLTYAAELIFIVVHGLLHLAGMDDETEAGWRKMRREGERLCKKIMAEKR